MRSWVTVNYALGLLTPQEGQQSQPQPQPPFADGETVGTLDLGGASTQIAFVPTTPPAQQTQQQQATTTLPPPRTKFSKRGRLAAAATATGTGTTQTTPTAPSDYVTLQLLGKSHTIYAVSFLDYGAVSARMRVNASLPVTTQTSANLIYDPCVNGGYLERVQRGSLLGTGNYSVRHSLCLSVCFVVFLSVLFCFFCILLNVVCLRRLTDYLSVLRIQCVCVM